MEIIPGVHLIRLGPWQSYALCEADRITLIDSGVTGDAHAILDAIADIGARPEQVRQIVITHYHDDHRGSAAELAELTGATVIAHRMDAPVVRGEQSQAEPRLSEQERAIWDVKLDVPPAPPTRVDREVEDGEEIDVGGGALIVGVPGHTAGSIAVYVPGMRALFTGDAVASVNGRPIVGVFNEDPEEAVASFRKLAELDFDAAFFGHGEPLSRDAALAFRRRVERLA